MYENSPISPDTKWPPSPGKDFINLVVVEDQGQISRDEYIGYTLLGNVEHVLKKRKAISIEHILEPIKSQDRLRLVFIEGAPGIGKSTLAWELCRKWEEFSCMWQYSLVVLLRLREEEVQIIESISQLFCQYESEDKKALVEEVSKSQGSGVLFILDGFDELPKTLQKKSFLLNIIKGRVLPASTVLVTSRPSASAELLTSCRPQIQKHIEILGFTQESVEAYASSIFSSELGKLEKFKAYISASKNPAINSLMYVPLNAAIIVEIYCNCKSNDFLPNTLTELYIQLCLTLLNRYLKICHPSINGVVDFDDLPPDLYQQFLHLSQVAFNGIEREDMIFHTPLPSLGFLDSVSALYGGGGVSYNFLHLTVQEFFAAYYISYLGSSGLDVFKQHGKDERWNVVWRFVAGLTKFKYYKGHFQNAFSSESRGHLGAFFIQCSFEAQSHFSILKKSPTKVSNSWSYTPLDLYALGYCLANFHTGVSWELNMQGTKLSPFICGLLSNMAGTSQCADLGKPKSQPFLDLSVLNLAFCLITNTDLVHLSELIPHMTCLKKLVIRGIKDTQGRLYQHDLLKTLHMLYYSNVVSLDISSTGFCKMLDSFSVYSSALKNLTTEKLEKLGIGDDNDHVDSGKLASLVSAPSSLKSLKLWCTSLSSHVSHLQTNTCLTKLCIRYSGPMLEEFESHIITILQHNGALQHLKLLLYESNNIDFEGISNAISENTTLQTLKIDARLFEEIRFQLDPRITIS